MTESESNSESRVKAVLNDDLLAVAEWIVGGDTGKSSKYMLATALAGATPKCRWGVEYPRDCADFGRCLRLIQSAPSVRNALPILAEASPKWAVLAAEWDALVTLHDGTLENDSYRWRVVTSRMDALFSSANVQGDGSPDTNTQPTR